MAGHEAHAAQSGTEGVGVREAGRAHAHVAALRARVALRPSAARDAGAQRGEVVVQVRREECGACEHVGRRRRARLRAHPLHPAALRMRRAERLDLACAAHEGLGVDAGLHAERSEHREPRLARALALGEDGLAAEDVREQAVARVEHLGGGAQPLAVTDGYEGGGPQRGTQPAMLGEGPPVTQQVGTLRALHGAGLGAEAGQQLPLEDVGVA